MAEETTLIADGSTSNDAGQQSADDSAKGADDSLQAKPAGETKPAEGEGTKLEAEVDYTFTAPEGVTLDPKRTEEFTAIAKDLKLPKEAAQRLVDLEVARSQAAVEAFKTQVSGWAEEVKADKEIGGDALNENLAIAKKAVDLGGPELKALLNSTGLGNHPAVVKWALKVGKTLSEDRFVPAKSAAAPQGDAASRLYPKTPA